jgi:hypothetical protein
MARRLPSLLSRSLMACVPVFGLLVASGAGSASAAPVPINVPSAPLAALKHLMIGEHGTNRAVGGQTALGSFGPKKEESGNWSGYADDNSQGYTMVTARWKEPAIACTKTTPPSVAAFWVGIDGYGSATVEQDGSLAYCQGNADPNNPGPFYYTWWEMAPKDPIEYGGSSVEVGDQITASVTRIGTKYTLKVVDSPHSDNNFTKYQYCAAKTCVDSSAEWVAEAPTGPCGQYPLASFDRWQVSSASVESATKSGTISSFPDYVITMTAANKAVLAGPGTLNEAGNEFTDTWDAAGGTSC